MRPTAQYEYDTLYRLTSGRGRELAALSARQDSGDVDLHGAMQMQVLPEAIGNLQAVRQYTESYDYDLVGNILEMKHAANGQTVWTRRYQYDNQMQDGRPRSNRLAKTTDANDSYTLDYPHDDAGNMQSVGGALSLEWDERNRQENRRPRPDRLFPSRKSKRSIGMPTGRWQRIACCLYLRSD